jgi:hypothetical protein
VHGAMISHLQEVGPPESIESIWTRLTGPKINLDAAGPEGSASQKELAAAARTILSASTPGADPFTQGWLLNAAKTIMNAAQKSEDPQEMKYIAAAGSTSEPLRADIEAPATIEESQSPRPAWVDNPPKLVGNTQRVVVSTDPYSSVPEVYAALREKLRGAVHARIVELAEAANGGHYAYVPEIESMGISIDYIASELCPEPDYIETVNSPSVGPMKRAHALLEFNDAQDQFLLDSWKAFARVQSVEMVGGLAALVVAGLAFIYGLLKIDTWTRGYYTKRLFLGVPAAIIAVFCVAALFLA